MLLSLFLLGTWPFWLLLGITSMILLALIEHEKPFWATVTLVATFAALHYFGDFNIVAVSMANVTYAVAFVLGYFAVGTGWAIAKWFFYVRNLRQKYDEIKTEFLERKKIASNVIPDHLKKEWKETLKTQYSRKSFHSEFNPDDIIPRARSHKGKIMLWMTYWPWSMVWTLIDDPIKKLFREIYNQIAQMLQSIANRAFQGTEADLVEPEPPPAPPSTDDGVTNPPTRIYGDRGSSDDGVTRGRQAK